MKQFRKLEIQNFQSHEHTIIDLSPGLNVFVGASDNGKSAILRALRWVLFNVPRGTEYIRTGTTKCQVTLTMDDGTEIQRVRSTGSINRYILRKPNEEELVFEGFGSEVPQEITDVHQMSPVRLDTTQEMLLQFGSQLEGPFLLSESPGTKAKMLGFISGAQIIDIAFKHTNSDRSKILEHLRSTERNQIALREQLEPYENLADLRMKLDVAKEKINRIKEMQARVQQLRKTAHRYTEIQQEKAYWSKILQSLANLPKAEQKKLELEIKAYHQIQLRQIYQRWSSNQSEKKYCQQQLALLHQTPEAEDRLCQLVEYSTRLKQLLRLQQSQKSLQWEQKQTIEILKKSSRLEEASNRFDQMMREYEQKTKLEHRWKAYHSIYVQKHQLVTVLEQTATIDHAYRVSLPTLESQTRKIELYREKLDKYVYLRQWIMHGKKLCADHAEEIKHFTEKYVQLLRVNGKCPTCGLHIDGDVLEHLMSELGGEVYETARR